MAEALRADEIAVVVAETEGPDEHQQLDPTAELRLMRCDRAGIAAAGEPALLTEAVRTLDLPPGAGHAYLSTEATVVRGLRTVLGERGMAPDAVSPKAYWRRGRANAAYGEPPRDEG
jgi:NADPH-dependent ferric siderophore reductase